MVRLNDVNLFETVIDFKLSSHETMSLPIPGWDIFLWLSQDFEQMDFVVKINVIWRN